MAQTIFAKSMQDGSLTKEEQELPKEEQPKAKPQEKKPVDQPVVQANTNSNYLTARERAFQNQENTSNRTTGQVKVSGRRGITYRESFSQTASLGKKLNDYIRENGLNKSEFIRQAISHELAGKVGKE